MPLKLAPAVGRSTCKLPGQYLHHLVSVNAHGDKQYNNAHCASAYGEGEGWAASERRGEPWETGCAHARAQGPESVDYLRYR